MIAFDPNSTCEQAKAYYYQYLSGDTKECVPTLMCGHIDRCSSCQAEVSRLKVILAEGEEHAVGSAGQTNTAITTYLRFHFAYLRAFVGCNTLKLFLPSLAIPALEVSVPTPITVHLDNCKQCADDLEAIRQLKLTGKQLGRLGQLFAEEPRIDTNVCPKAQNAIASVGAMVFEGTSPAILKHLCVCPECRKLLYEELKGRREKLPQNLEQSPIPCDAISPRDIFDYVIPYGIDPKHDAYAMFRESLTSHLINCPRCLHKMQKLHDTVYGILERHESGIITCYNINDSDRDLAVGSAEDMYKDWPIEVQVFDKSAEAETVEARDSSAVGDLAISLKPKPKRKLSSLNIRPFIKPAAAAAAAILIALLLFNIPVAKAVDIGQIYKALGRIMNVYFVTFDVEKAEPTQEVWVSRALNIKMFKTETECLLWDFQAKSQKLKDLNTGSITTAEVDGSILMAVEENMKIPWGLLPSKVHPNAKWQRVPDKDIETAVHDTEVYDLIWIEEKFASRKWRGYIDSKTKLPKRVEWWLKLAEEEEYKLETFTQVSYPTTVEMKAVIKEAGF
jgi:hypothetical protein